MVLRKNVWIVFNIMLFLSLGVLIALLYFRYTDINNRYHTQARHYAQMVAKTIHSDFLQEEMILDIVGKQLLEDNHYKNTKKTQKKLDNILSQNLYLIGFGLTTVDGKFIALSSNIQESKKINLAKDARTKDGFEKALKSHSMVIGRTYFFKAMGSWVIPLRKAIRDENGNIIGVMTSGVTNEKNTNYLDGLDLAKNNLIVIMNDYDEDGNMYRQYYSDNNSLSLKKLYTLPISSEQINNINKAIVNKYDFTLEHLKLKPTTVSVKLLDAKQNSQISGIIYDKQYHIYIIVGLDAQKVWNEFWIIFLLYISFYIIVFIIIYKLFDNIANAEQRKNEELIYLAQHDVLTNLPNRTFMYANIKKWRKKHTKFFDVLYLDLDNFKNINDKFGHHVGDKILIEVAKRLKSFFSSEDDMLIRQGGDEFIVLKECLDEVRKEKNFVKLIELISQTYYIDKREFRIGISVGSAHYPKDAQTIEELLSLADTAMYEAKKQKNSYCLFSKKMRQENTFKADIEQELRGALDNNELSMVYQPQINAEDETIYGVEALIRWNNKKLGVVDPDIFIAVAEVSGLMKKLGKFIITTSLKDIKKLKQELGIDFQLSINISVVQLIETNFLKDFLKLIEQENFQKDKLTMEITESLSIEDLDKVLPLLHAIRDEGIEISLDDFGTGYSSLSVLKELPITELKIDKSFIDEIIEDDTQKALVQSIINIGKNFKMKTLAEGVETREQVEMLKADRCDMFQGYFYSHPLSYEDLKFFIKEYI